MTEFAPSPRSPRHLRRWLIVTGTSVLLLAVGTPAFQHWGLGAASASMGVGLLWLVMFVASVLAGVCALLLAIPSSSGPLLVATRWCVQVAVLGLLAIHGFYLVTMTHTTIIGPSAEVIVPDGYSGMLGIRIRNPVEPGRATIGKTYVYALPENGFLEVGPGWIAATFRFDRAGASLPDRYTTRMRWANGAPMTGREFDCTWVEDYAMEAGGPRPLSLSPRTQALACMVQPGATGRTSIDYKEAHRWFRSRPATPAQP